MATELEVTAKAQPYIFDPGHLLVTDPNPIPNLTSLSAKEKEAALASVARDNAQALITQLLKACPITKNADDQSLQLTLPAPSIQLPREKPVPKEKEKSKWEKFAAKKGITGKAREDRKKMVYDEAKGDWVPKWGYKGKKTEGEDWLVEVDEKKERAAAAEPKAEKGVRGAGKGPGGKAVRGGRAGKSRRGR